MEYDENKHKYFATNLSFERQKDLNSPEEAGKVVMDLLAVRDLKLKSFYDQAKARGLEDIEIEEAIVSGIREGILPGVAERRMSLRDGKRPIFLMKALPEKLQGTIVVSANEDSVRVAVREFRQTTNSMIEDGTLIALTPGSDTPELLNPESDWDTLINDLMIEVDK